MDPNFKDSTKDSAIKRLVCYTVWHSSFNGFMAVQTQLGCFQNGTHLFFFLPFLWVCALDKRPSGNDQLYWILPNGDAQDSRSFGVIFCSYLGTFRPLLFCWACLNGEGAIKPAASFKHSSWPIFDVKMYSNINKFVKRHKRFAELNHNVTF